MKATETIVALSTPYGRSGIGLIRLSGENSLSLTRKLLRDASFAPEPNRVALKSIFDLESEKPLDRALVTYFKAPHSFTGEDVVELSCHGSPPLLLHIIDALLRSGARTADPGEFTLRALSNGRLNLSQAEAIRDLIEAQTLTAVQQAARQLGGELSTRLQPIRDELVSIIVPLESALEFVEDDLPEEITAHVAQKLEELTRQLEQLAATFRAGRLLKDGLKVALIGRPNVGKSSIFNALLARERAIVTDVPGTTRDSLTELISINDVPVLLIDTAGVRASSDKIERLGIERTHQAIVDADFIVVVMDGSQPTNDEDHEVLASVAQNRYLIALNKSDLENFRIDNAAVEDASLCLIPVSAKTKAGIDELCTAILEPFISNGAGDSGLLITNARHYDLLRRAADSLLLSQQLLNNHTSEELSLTGLYDALRSLGEITGEITSEDILTQIFSTFCIGK